MQHASRFEGIQLSVIRQLNALARPDSINLGIGEPNLAPDEALLEMARGAASEGAWRYSPNAGFESLRRVIASTNRPTYDPFGEICITAGTQEGLYAVTQAFVDDGDEVLVPDPGFLSYPTLVRLAGGVPVPYPLWRGDWSIDVEAIESLINERTKMIIVNSPANPTGGVATGEQMVELCRIAEEHDVLVVSDEVYREIWYDEPPATMAGISKNAIVIDGLSKSHGMTGLRIGWILADVSLMSTIVTAHQYIATCASVFSQRLAERILENEDWNRDWLDRARRRCGTRRDRDPGLGLRHGRRASSATFVRVHGRDDPRRHFAAFDGPVDVNGALRSVVDRTSSRIAPEQRPESNAPHAHLRVLLQSLPHDLQLPLRESGYNHEAVVPEVRASPSGTSGFPLRDLQGPARPVRRGTRWKR